MYLSEAFDRHPRAPAASFGLLPSRVGWSGHLMHAQAPQGLDIRRADGGVIRYAWRLFTHSLALLLATSLLKAARDYFIL